MRAKARQPSKSTKEQTLTLRGKSICEKRGMNGSKRDAPFIHSTDEPAPN
jgi:hypothetical protein